jgi:hypothetical protein
LIFEGLLAPHVPGNDKTKILEQAVYPKSGNCQFWMDVKTLDMVSHARKIYTQLDSPVG